MYSTLLIQTVEEHTKCFETFLTLRSFAGTRPALRWILWKTELCTIYGLQVFDVVHSMRWIF